MTAPRFIPVTKVYEQSPGVRSAETTRTCYVNLDLVAAIEPLPNGRTRLIWHTTSPRCQWIILESASDLLCTSDDPTNHQGETCPVHEGTTP